MTPNSAYLQWLDTEINYLISIKTTEFGDGCLSTFKKAREKFLSLYPSQEVDNDETRQFTDGLD